jgi:hypothetical protein
MTAWVLLALLAQGDGVAAEPKAKRPFSDAFYRTRAEQAEASRPSWRDRVAFSFGVSGGLEVLPSSEVPVAPTIGVDLELGAHLGDWASLVVQGQLRSMFLMPGFEDIAAGFGAGVRLGRSPFVTLGGGVAKVLEQRVSRSRESPWAPTIDLRGFVPLAWRVGLHLRAGVVLLPSGPLLNVSLGFAFAS